MTDASTTLTLDVATDRGRIHVSVGSDAEVVVIGRVSVRSGFNVPSDAVALAQATANRPPVERAGDALTLRRPSQGRTRNAVTIAFDVRVPASTHVVTESGSGETSIDGVRGKLTVKTGSGAIHLSNLGGGGTTAFIGDGDVDVETASSEIRLDGVRGGMTAATGSGRVTVSGHPAGDWRVTTGSGQIDVTVGPEASFSVDATSGSGSVRAQDLMVEGEVEKRRLSGAINGGGPVVRLTSRSASITRRAGR